MCWNATWRTKIVLGGLSLTYTERQPSLPFTTEELQQRGAAPSPVSCSQEGLPPSLPFSSLAS